MPIITIKRILDEYQIKYINVNVVRSTLHLGVKNAELQRRHEQLLPDDVFIQIILLFLFPFSSLFYVYSFIFLDHLLFLFRLSFFLVVPCGGGRC